MVLTSNRYGKGRVRVLRLDRSGPAHAVRELTVEALLTGGFDRAYTAADNSAVVATDTIKNIVNALAADHVAADAEPFCQVVAAFFLERYAHVSAVDVHAVETRWTRLAVDGAPHPHAFTLDANGRPFVRVRATREAVATSSGVVGFTFMKTTGNGWSNFHTDEYRTLADTDDRIVATAMDATWTWSAAPASYLETNARILDVMLAEFATTYSHGVQDSMNRMGEAALAAAAEIGSIRFAMPNKHYIPMDLSRFGRDAAGQVFLPTDEPHGHIEAEIARG
jgi:urate oxidase